MKHFFYALALLIMPSLLSAQDADYQMFENFYFTPKAGHADELASALSAHNKKWHPAGDAYSAQVYYVMNGPRAGQMVWSMGPTTWTQIASRPEDKEHDGDWDKNIAVHIETYGATDYYKLDADQSNFTGEFDLNTLELWLVDVKEGEGYRFNALMERVNTANKEGNAETYMGVYDRQMSGSHGIDLAIVWFHDSVADFDQDSGFAQRYEAKYGEGSMKDLMSEWQAITESVEVEIWQFDPEMSGHDGKAQSRAAGN